MHFDRILSKHSNETLRNVCVHCGIGIKGRKSELISCISDGIKFLDLIPKNVKVLSMDMGMKNLSCCRIEQSDILEKPFLKKKNWNKFDLHEVYGKHYNAISNDLLSLVESQRYQSYLAFELLNDLVIKRNEIPDIIVLEHQRTRSNGLHATLPNVMNNFMFEHMLNASFYTLQQFVPQLSSAMIIPMSSGKMMNFWVNRFLGEQSKSLASDTKKIRSHLVFNWFCAENPPFHHDLCLPAEFANLTSLQKSKCLLGELGLPSSRNKVDDLVDSFLYAMTSHKYLQNIYKLREWLVRDRMLEDFVENLRAEQFELVRNSLSFQFNLDSHNTNNTR